MSFWQNLVTSYDENSSVLEKMFPLSTTSISNHTEWIAVIIIDGKGEFQSAYPIKKSKKNDKTKEWIVSPVSVNIPVREKSAGRTRDAKTEPHPVFEQYAYFVAKGEQFDRYMAELGAFANSEYATPQVKSIYSYISKRTVEDDLQCLKPKGKTLVLFEVQLLGEEKSKIWEDTSFFEAWHLYYMAVKKNLLKTQKDEILKLRENTKLTKEEKGRLQKLEKSQENLSLDFIDGTMQLATTFHPKKISNASANAKLISANDETNFTFRGRFENANQAVSVSYEATQKAHQFLRYLVKDRGVYCGEQVILSFTVGSATDNLPSPLDDTKCILDRMLAVQTNTDAEGKASLRAITGHDYSNGLKKALEGQKYSNALGQHPTTAIIVLDAPISGRMSITFYRELARNEYLEKIANWHNACKWNQHFWSSEAQRTVCYVGAPSVDHIIEAVYGKPRGRNDESYTKIKKSARERLLRCIFDGECLTADYISSAVHRASNPLAVTKNNGSFDRNGFDRLLSTACAIVRKDSQQRNMEEQTLSLDPTRTDRDYLYGRLLGAADKLEEYALRKKDNNRIVTAAIRHMQAFSQHPFRTWKTIHDCLSPYIQSEKGRFAFTAIEEIMSLFKHDDYEKNAPLSGSYLIGYYHQRAHIKQLALEAKATHEPSTPNQEKTNE